MSTPPPKRSPRLDELDALRGVMALWVVVSHIIPRAGLDAGKWPLSLGILADGRLAVDIFIIMSGFVIFYLLSAKAETYKSFIFRRFMRLFPAYFICLVLSALTLNINLETLRSLPWENARTLSSIARMEDVQGSLIPHFLAHTALLHGAVPDSLLRHSSLAIIGQAWSISLEWQFYIVSFFIFNWVTKGKLLTKLLCIGGCWGLYLLLQGKSDAFLPTQVPYFFIGCASFFLWKNCHQLQLTRNQLAITVPSIIICVANFTHSIPLIIWTAIFACTVAVTINPKTPLAKPIIQTLRGSEPLKQLGMISYSVYLIHMLIISGLSYLLRNQAEALGPWPYFSIMLVATTILTLIVSYLLFHYVEKPCMQWAKQRVKCWSTA